MNAQNESAARCATRLASVAYQIKPEDQGASDREQQKLVNRFQVGDPAQVARFVAQ
jgi:hypothetical protein